MCLALSAIGSNTSGILHSPLPVLLAQRFSVFRRSNKQCGFPRDLCSDWIKWTGVHVTPHAHSVPARPETSQCRSLLWDVLSRRGTFCPVRLFGGGRLVVAWEVLLYVRAARWERWRLLTPCNYVLNQLMKKKGPPPHPAYVCMCVSVCVRVLSLIHI